MFSLMLALFATLNKIQLRNTHQILDTQGHNLKCVANFSEYYSKADLANRSRQTT